MRIGLGYDIHKLVLDRDLILGGVKIPYNLGFLLTRILLIFMIINIFISWGAIIRQNFRRNNIRK